MKTGIITINGHINYGNRLQNYALQTVLKKYGDSQSLWWQNFEFITKDSFSLKDKIKVFFNYHNYQHKLIHDIPLGIVRQLQIKKFSDHLIDIKHISSLNNEEIDSYDFFIAGSDQIWNPYFWPASDKDNYENTLFLQFVKKTKRIAYAASFGLSDLPRGQNKRFASLLNSIEHISVREQAGADIIKKLTGRSVPVVLDPTLLISSDRWASIEMKPEWYHGEKYMLTYFLGNMPDSVLTFAKKRNLRVYNLTDISNLNLYTSRVEEFIFLIHNSEIFCTDSFHGCVFALQFRKPFIVMERQQNGMCNMTSRISTLLNTFKLHNGFLSYSSSVSELEKLVQPNYSNFEDLLKIEKKKSINFIEKSMNIISD